MENSFQLQKYYKFNEKGIVIPPDQELKATIPFKSSEVIDGQFTNERGLTYKRSRISSGLCIILDNDSKLYISASEAAETPNAVEVVYDVFVSLGNHYDYCYITALVDKEDGEEAIGFRDFRINHDSKIATGNGSMLNRQEYSHYPELNPELFYIDIRVDKEENIDSSHSIFVARDFRLSKTSEVKLGRSLLFTGLKLAQLLGAIAHVIEHDGTSNYGRKPSYYSQFIKIKPGQFQILIPLNEETTKYLES